MEKYVIVDDSESNPSGKPRRRTKLLVLIGSLVAITAIVVVIAGLVLRIERSEEDMPSEPLARANILMQQQPLLDSHNDLPWQYRERVNNNISALNIRENLNHTTLQTDIPRIRQGRLGAQIWSVFVPCTMPNPVQSTMEQIDVVYRLTEAYPDVFQLAVSSGDILPAFQSGKVASFIGMEGGHSINSSMGLLRAFYHLGARYLTLTHTCSTPWAQSANDVSGTVIGLTTYGRQIVREMNRIGMMVDLSHVAVQTMYDALNTSTAPIIFSHSNARALCNNIRNVPDDVLARLPENGGVVMVVLYPAFVCERYRLEGLRLANITGCDPSCVSQGLVAFQATAEACNVSDVADHIDYIKSHAGIDHIGIGSDFDGVDALPVGLEDVSKYPNLIAELVRRGYSDDDVKKVLSRNMIRVLQRVEEEAERLQQSDPAGP